MPTLSTYLLCTAWLPQVLLLGSLNTQQATRTGCHPCLHLSPSTTSSVPPFGLHGTWNTALYAYRAEAAAPRSGQLFIDVDASSVVSTTGALDDASIALAPVSPSISRITWTSAGSKSKKPIPYPSSKPPTRRRATDDDVHAAQTLVRPPAPTLPEDVIVLTSDSGISEADDLATRTARKAPSPDLPAVSPVSEPASEPASEQDRSPPIIMSPSIVSPRKTRSAKVVSKMLLAVKRKAGKSRMQC